MDIPGAVYALLTIPIPEPETYDITWSDMEPPDTSDLCGPDYSITGVLVPEFWDLDQVDFYVGDEEEPLMPVEFYQDYVFGQFFLRVEEVYDELNGLRSYRYEYNPDNPFETINSGP
jgi:hypothetical protein